MAVQSLYQSKREQFVDANGKPIVSGKLYIGAVNTDPTIGGNQIPVYPSRADAIAGTNALSQPLLTDSYGRTDESVWVTTSYAYVLTDSADAQLLTEPYIEVVDIAQEIQDAIDAALSTLEQAYVNLFVNGAMAVASGSAVTLTGSFLEGEVTRTYGRALNVSAGTMEQGSDDEFGSTGWNASFLGVSCPNTSDYVEFQVRIASQDAIRMANRAAMFSALVDHDVGSSVDYTITFAVADALDDFSAVTVVETSSDLPVANEAATRIEFTTADMGDCSNGVAITIRAKAGQITTKNFRFTEIQPEVGATRTVFQTLGYDVAHLAATDRTETLDLTGSGDFTGGTFVISRIGNVVTMALVGGSATCTGAAIQQDTAVGFLPIHYRPSSSYLSVRSLSFGNTAALLQNVTVLPDGQIQVTFFDGAKATASVSSVAPFTMSWVV